MKRWVKVLIACALLAALAAGVDWQAIPAQLARLQWWPLAAAVLITASELPVKAWKWLCSLRLHDVRLPMPFVLRASCTAFFLNNFLPSNIGGDVYRIYRTMSPGGEKTRPISAVLVERVVGLGVMLLAGALGAIALAGENALARSYLVVTAVVLLIAGIAAAVLHAGGLASLVRRLERMPKLQPLAANVQRLAKLRPEWAWLLLSSFVFQMQAAAVVYFAFLAVGVELSVAAALLVTAAAGIASVLPISISGIGVIEGAIAGTAVALGIGYEAGVLGAIAIRLTVLPVSAACGAVYLFDDGARVRAAV